MSRVIQLKEELRRRGQTGQVTQEQAVDALRSLPDPLTHPVDRRFDDRHDYRTEVMLLNIQHPQLLNLKPPTSKIKRPKLSSDNKIRTVTALLDATTSQPPTAVFNRYFSGARSSDKVAMAKELGVSIEPLLRVRVQALVCRNDDGKLTSGSAGQTKQQLAASIDKIIDAVNKIFSGSGIEFVFYPSADIELRNDTRLNQDFLLSASQQLELYPGTLNPDRKDQLENVEGPLSTFSYRNQVCKQYPQKLVLLFAEGTYIDHAPNQSQWRRCKKCESLFFGDGQTVSRCPSGGQHDADLTWNYIVYAFPTDGFSADPTSADLQKGWRWCQKCQSLFFGAGVASRCPAGGSHDGSASGFYVLDYISSIGENFAQVVDNKSQANWRWCNKCQGLYLAANQTASNCPAGGQHNSTDSANYVLLSDQSNVRYVVMSPSGFGFSGSEHGFAKLSADVPSETDQAGIDSYATFVAHEMGHYLSLWHTFVPIGLPKDKSGLSVPDKITYLKNTIRDYLESELAKQHVTQANLLDALNGDMGSEVFDTPPDDGGDLIHYLNIAALAHSDSCGPVGTCQITLNNGSKVSYSPDRSLVMSYFKGCINFNQHFSPDQITRMRKHLINGFRRPLVATQLGDSATSNERMCAVWSPNTNGQVYVTGYQSNDFKKKSDEMNKANFRLTHQQGYTRNGQTLYDGIFNPGTVPELIVWGWAVNDFKAKDTEVVKTGWRLIHLESYLLPNGEVRMNAIWNQNNWATSWFQGYSFNDADKALKQWQSQGIQPVHINGWHLANNEVRYDAIGRPSKTMLPYFLGWAENDFKKLYDEKWKQNQKLSLLDITKVGDGTIRLNGVFTPDTQAQFITWNATREQVRQYYDEMWAIGLKLRTMNMVRM